MLRTHLLLLMPPSGPAFERIYTELGSDLRRFLSHRLRQDPAAVDDVLQDTFLRAQSRVESLRDDDKLVPWIYRIAHHTALDHLRSRHRDGEELPDNLAADEMETHLQEPDWNRMLGAWLKLQIAELPETYRQALELTEIEGKSQREVAAILGLSDSGARTRVQRGRQLLAAELASCCRVERDARGNVIDCEPRQIANGGGRGCC